MSRYEFQKEIQKRLDETIFLIGLRTEIRIKEIYDKRKAQLWDIFKILIGAILGSALTWYIKYFVEISDK